MSNAKGKKKPEEFYSAQGVSPALPSSWWKKTGNYEESLHWQMLGLAAVAAEGVSVKSGWFDSEIQCFLISVRTAVSHSICVCVHACSVVSDSVTPWTVACQALMSMGFSRQEYLSGLPFPSPGNLPQPGTEPMFPALAGRFFTSEPPGKPLRWPSIHWRRELGYQSMSITQVW